MGLVYLYNDDIRVKNEEGCVSLRCLSLYNLHVIKSSIVYRGITVI